MTANTSRSILATIPGYTPGGWRRSALGSDLYKFSMMLGGRPDEKECFYLSFRKGLRLFMPVDIDQEIESLQPQMMGEVVKDTAGSAHSRLHADAEYLKSVGCPVPRTTLSYVAVDAWETVYATPKGEWADPREPVATIRATQAFASWIEPMFIGRMSYMMQVATAALESRSGTEEEVVERYAAFLKTIETVTCEEQKALTLRALEGAGVSINPDYITVDEEGYYNAVKAQCQKMLDTGVSPDRFFEVGLRAATCMDQHLIALKAMKDMGFTKTSNVYGAWLLGMTPVGTMGHEGVMRWGGNDELAFRQHQKALPVVSFLLDTNDTLTIGLPIALKLMLETPDRRDGARPDSGDLDAQFRTFVGLMKANTLARPWIFEDGIGDKDVCRFEALRTELDYPEAMTLYGAGGYFIDRVEPTGYTRGRINMIYKLTWTQSFGAAMKFGNEEEAGDSGKASLPGIPVTYTKIDDSVDGPNILVGQECDVLPGYRPYRSGDHIRRGKVKSRPDLSPLTRMMIDMLTKNRAAKVAAAKEA